MKIITIILALGVLLIILPSFSSAGGETIFLDDYELEYEFDLTDCPNFGIATLKINDNHINLDRIYERDVTHPIIIH